MPQSLSLPDPAIIASIMAKAAADQAEYAAQRRRLAEEWEAARNQRQDQQFSEAGR